MRLLPVLIALPLLAACNVKTDDKDGTSEVSIDKTVVVKTKDGSSTVSVSGDNGFKIDTDEFKAAIDIPGMTIGGKAFNIDDMTLFPGSKVSGMKVVAHDKDGAKDGTVTVSFTSPGSADAVLAHAEAEAKDEGWTVTRGSGTLNGTKGDKTLAYAVAATGTTAAGTVKLTGED